MCCVQMLKTIPNKKIHPQHSNAIAKKYLENRKTIDEARPSVEANKWSKTDSECETFSLYSIHQVIKFYLIIYI